MTSCMNNKIIIPLSKRKALVAWGGSTVFVVVGYLIFIHPENFMSIIVRNIAIVKSVGAMSMIFFGCCFIAILLKLLDSKPGLTIDDTGITFNTSALGRGHGGMEWYYQGYRKAGGIDQVADFKHQESAKIHKREEEFFIKTGVQIEL